MGAISHGVADVLWHSLSMNEGFIQAMQFSDFNSSYPDAHSAADFGGDFVLSRFGQLDYKQNVWHVPTKDIIKIYASLGHNVTTAQLNLCMVAGYMGLHGGSIIGKYLYPQWALNSPFLAERYFDYIHGGVNSLSVAVAECWSRATEWILNEDLQEISQCSNMGYAYSKKNSLRSQKMFGISKVADITLQDGATSASNDQDLADYVPRRTRPYEADYREPLLKQISRGLKSWVQVLLTPFIEKASSLFAKRCVLINDAETVIVTNNQYSMLGHSIAYGDFDNDGQLELVIGAPGYSTKANFQSGAVFVMGDLPKRGTYLVEEYSQMIMGPLESGTYFGYSLAVVDLNRDGIDDLAIGSPGLGFNLNYPDGSVFVRFGQKGKGLRKDGWDLVLNGTIYHQNPEFAVFPKDSYNSFGEKLFAFDVDKDGYNDLIVGSPLSSNSYGSHQRGSIHCFLAASNHSRNISFADSDWSLYGQQDYEWFGSSFVFANDMIVVGSPGYKAHDEAKSNGMIQGFKISSEIQRPEQIFSVQDDIDFSQFGQ
jgi:glycosylphosphatidylinositol phospholipase D